MEHKPTKIFRIFAVVLAGVCLCKGDDPVKVYTPIVLWHGMGDSCCFQFSLGAVSKMIQESLPGIYIRSLRIGSTVVRDIENGFFMHPNKQVAEACRIVNADPLLQNGYNAIGFSQGAQFLRALVQRCNGPQVKNLISIGGQHQGVYGLPNCPSMSSMTCDYMRRVLNYAAYFSWAQHKIVQATYWHDPIHDDDYIKGSTFLADINNERSYNNVYVKRLTSLENFVLVKFENDTMVQPVATEWFGFYKPNQARVTETLQQSDLYLKDRLGLKQMDSAKKLHFLSVEGNHLQFGWKWFKDNIIYRFLTL